MNGLSNPSSKGLHNIDEEDAEENPRSFIPIPTVLHGPMMSKNTRTKSSVVTPQTNQRSLSNNVPNRNIRDKNYSSSKANKRSKNDEFHEEHFKIPSRTTNVKPNEIKKQECEQNISNLSIKLNKLGLLDSSDEEDHADDDDDDDNSNEGENSLATTTKQKFLSDMKMLLSSSTNSKTSSKALTNIMQVFECVLNEAIELGEAAEHWQKREEEAAENLQKVIIEMRKERSNASSSPPDHNNCSSEKSNKDESTNQRVIKDEQNNLNNMNTFQNIKYPSAVNHLQSHQIEAIKNELIEKEKEIFQLRQMNQKLKYDIDELRHAIATKSQELQRAESNLALVTRESLVISNENTRLSSDISSFQQKLQEITIRADRSDHTLRTMAMEKNEIIANYRAVVEERSMLERNIEEMSALRQRMTSDIIQLKETNHKCQSQIQDREQQIHQRIAEISSLQRQIDAMTQQLISAQQAYESLQEENHTLAQDLHSSRNNLHQMSCHIQELQRSMATASHHVETSKTSVSSLQQERGILEQYLSDERRRVDAMEQLLSSTRAKEAAANEQIRKLAKENVELCTKVNDAKARAHFSPSTMPASAYNNPAGDAWNRPSFSSAPMMASSATSHTSASIENLNNSSAPNSSPSPLLSDYLTSENET